jgi:thiamine pyrophosphokinase
MTRFAILLGGDLVVTPRLSRQLAGARVIAADSGMRHAAALGLTPELWTGDFDSVEEGLRAFHADVPMEIFPPEKDQTDGEIAVDAALKRGARELVLVGAFGGERADHAWLHLAAALRLAETGMFEGLTLSGAKWPLDRRFVPFGSSLTLSNEVRGALTARLDAGRAMLLARPASYYAL